MQKMTAEDAQHFSHKSLQNAFRALEELTRQGVCDGTCTPYSDIFTFQRWLAQGLVVKKGEHGAKLSTIINTEKTRDDGTVIHSRMPWMTTVFCRHQVQERR